MVSNVIIPKRIKIIPYINIDNYHNDGRYTTVFIYEPNVNVNINIVKAYARFFIYYIKTAIYYLILYDNTWFF